MPLTQAPQPSRQTLADDHWIIAFNEEAVLLEGSCTNGWRNLKLELRRTQGSPKANWWLAWNGDRLARGRDAKLLIQYRPDLYAWVVAILTR